jgi:hypothetical protein
MHGLRYARRDRFARTYWNVQEFHVTGVTNSPDRYASPIRMPGGLDRRKLPEDIWANRLRRLSIKTDDVDDGQVGQDRNALEKDV